MEYRGVDRADVLAARAFGSYADIYNEHELEVTEGVLSLDVYDPKELTVAIYASRSFEGAELLGQAALQLRASGEPAVNFVVVPPGVYAESFSTKQNHEAMFVYAGYVINHDGEFVVFEQDDPIQVVAVDIGENSMIKTPTKTQIDNLGLISLRPPDSFIYGDKEVLKNHLSRNGIAVPETIAVLEDEKYANNINKQPVVVKPADSLRGRGVTMLLDEYTTTELKDATKVAREFDEKVLVEQYIPQAELNDSDFPEGADWNLRVVAFNGYCGSFVRANHHGLAVNGASGAKLMSAEKALDALTLPEYKTKTEVMQNITKCADAVCSAIPNTAMGMDIIIDPKGNPYVIEVNIADFGAFSSEPEAFEPGMRMEGAKTMVRNITTSLHEQRSKSIDQHSEELVSVIDRGGYLLGLLLGNNLVQDDEDSTDYVKFVADNQNTIVELTDLSQEYGEELYAVETLSGLLGLVMDAGHKTLTDKVLTALKSSQQGRALIEEDVRDGKLKL